MQMADPLLQSLAGSLSLGRFAAADRVLMDTQPPRLQRRSPFFHFVLVRSGRMGVRISGGRGFACSAGQGVLVAPQTMHDFGFGGWKGTLCWADFTIACWGVVPIADLLDFPVHLSPANAESLAGQAMVLAAGPGSALEGAARLAWFHRQQSSLVSQVLALGSWKPDADRRSSELQRLAPLLAEIAERLDESWPRQRLASASGIGLTRLTSAFTAATGAAPACFVRRLRLTRAAELLLTTDLMLAAIAKRLGFVDAFHLSKTFKAEHGMAPANYRNHFRRRSAMTPTHSRPVKA